MEKNEYVVAIDLGTSKVVTLVGRKGAGGKAEVLAGSVSDSLSGVARGEIKNTEHVLKALKETIENIENELGIGIKEAYVGISGQHIKCSRHSGYIFIENNDNEVRPKDVQRLNESMHNVQVPVGETIIHILPQKYTVDGESDISEPVGVIGKKLEASFNIITGDRNAIIRVDKCLSRLSVNVSQHILNPLASAEAVLVPDEKELGVAVVDIGGGTTDVCIYHDNIVRHVGIVPLGGNIVNKDIRSYGILERHVENLKVKFGSAVGELERPDKFITIPGLNARDPKEISFRNLASIIEARMLDIIDCVNLEIRKSGYQNRLGAGIVLTGGCAKLRNLDVLFRRHTGQEVRVAVPENHITAESLELVNSPAYATAVGLLLKAINAGVTMYVENQPKAAAATTGAATAVAGGTVNDRYAGAGSGSRQTGGQGRYRSGYGRKDAAPGAAEQQAQAAEEPEHDTALEEAEEQPAPRRKGVFGRLVDKFNNMFEVIDDDI
mgnify:FL=1